MKNFKFVVSLITENNDYQHELALSAEDTARRLGVEVQITYAENDADAQSNVLMEAINRPENQRPDGFIVMPVGNGRAEVAEAAAKAGIGWAVLNRHVDYIAELRRNYSAPIFSVSVDQEEIGRIQGRQISALLPSGGTIISLMGANGSLAASYRFVGMQSAKPANVGIRILRGDWTELGAYEAVKKWLRLSEQNARSVVLVAAQSDEMAMGARNALNECAPAIVPRVSFLGLDGTPKAQSWIRDGLLTASVVVPVTSGVALEMMLRALQTGERPERNAKVAPSPLPPFQELRPMAARQAL